MTLRTALIGHTGFVGGNLMRARTFGAMFNSGSISEIAGREFDLVVCAGAPATMWLANKDPEADAANLKRLIDRLTAARIGQLVLISTIAVFDDVSAGYTEDTAAFETEKAYGRNRRALEVAASEAFNKVHVVRLPALFGPGLRKNYLFDLLNPSPSFLRPDKFQEIHARLPVGVATLVGEAYAFRDEVGMWELDREGMRRSGQLAELDAVFEDVGFTARAFTNSTSAFQYYDITRLAGDIDTAIANDLAEVNIVSEPLRADTLCHHLLGRTFQNDGPSRVEENVCSVHTAAFGGSERYMFSRQAVLDAIERFFMASRPA